MTGRSTHGHPDPQQIMAWLDGERAVGDTDINEHLAACVECRAVADEFRRVSQHLAAWSVEISPLQLPPRQTVRRVSWRLVTMAASLFIGLIALWSVFGRIVPPKESTSVVTKSTMQDQATFERDWTTRARMDVGVPADGAAVVVVVFIDWQCPSCVHLEYAPLIVSYAAEHPGAVKYVLKDYPLNHACNPNVPTQLHVAACEAAAAVRMARDRGKANPFIDWILANQYGLTPDQVKSHAASMLGVEDFDAQYALKVDDIRRDVALATTLHVQFTPTVFVNGVSAGAPSGEAPSPQQLDRQIRFELGRAGRQ